MASVHPSLAVTIVLALIAVTVAHSPGQAASPYSWQAPDRAARVAALIPGRSVSMTPPDQFLDQLVVPSDQHLGMAEVDLGEGVSRLRQDVGLLRAVGSDGASELVANHAAAGEVNAQIEAHDGPHGDAGNQQDTG